MNLHGEVNKLTDNIGWRCFFELKLPAHDTLVREFYNTFSFDPPKDFQLNILDVLRFKVMGILHRFSLDDYNEALEFVDEDSFNDPAYLNSLHDYLSEFNPLDL